MQNRRNFIKKTTLLALGITISPSIFSTNFNSFFIEKDKIRKKSEKIHQRIFKLDSHCDTPLHLINTNFDITKKHDVQESNSCVDFPRMEEGDMNAMFWAVFLGQGERSEAGNKEALIKANQIFDAIHKVVKENPNLAEIARTSSDGIALMKKDKHAIYIGIENGYAIGNDIKLIKTFYDKGARYITLCHSSNNDICDSSTDKKGSEHNGVSDFGKEVIQEMNNTGLIVDVSHISDKSFYDVIELSKVPIVASHSCAKALCNHPRNMSDEMIKLLAVNGGVIQMCILSDYLKKPAPFPEREAAKQKVRDKYNSFKNLSDTEMEDARKAWHEMDKKYPPVLATVKDIVNHIDHIVKLVGINHIGIGTDFDGGGGISDCQDISQIGNITEELVRRNYSEKEIKKIWSENFLRVMKETEKYAKSKGNG